MISKRAKELLEKYDAAALTELYNEGYIDRSGVTQKGLDLLRQSKHIPDMLECAKRLKELWPKGSGPYGPWSSASVIIKKRLEQFTNKYGVYPFEDIINAASRYVNSSEFLVDKTYMQTLDNFIFYDKIGAAGTIDEKSKLLTFLEDSEAGNVNNTNAFEECR